MSAIRNARVAAIIAMVFAPLAATAGEKHGHGHDHGHDHAEHDHAHDEAKPTETRQLDAHVHGVSVLNVAIEGGVVSLEWEAPGFDIVGFEHEATSPEDKAAVEAAFVKLRAPETLFDFGDAQCAPGAADVKLVSDREHDHGDHGHGDDAHEKHGQGDLGHEDHGHEEIAEKAKGGHTEFEAAYRFDCAAPDALATIGLPLFDAFPKAERVTINLVSDKGQFAYDADRASPSVDVSGGV